MAGPDGRPTRTDRWRLVLDGLRERFRLPPRRPLAVVAAVLALLVGGALGAAAGSWAGMWTFAEVPAPGPMADRVLGADSVPDSLTQSRFWSGSDRVLKPGVDATAAADSARARMVADGWTATPVVVSGGGADGRYGPGLPHRRFVPAPGERGDRGGRARAVGPPRRVVYVFLVETLPDRSGLGAVEFVHRALGNSPAYTLNWWQTLGPSWLTAPYANKVLLLAGLAAVAGAAIIGRAGRATREPADPQAA
jgi:hypothetical protein